MGIPRLSESGQRIGQVPHAPNENDVGTKLVKHPLEDLEIMFFSCLSLGEEDKTMPQRHQIHLQIQRPENSTDLNRYVVGTVHAGQNQRRMATLL